MTLHLWELFLVALAYLAILFLVAYAAEEGWLPAGLARHPATYALSLGVYATTWTYYGSIGLAATQGYLFLTIYLGVTLTLMLWPALLAPLLRLVRDFQLQSLADLFVFRFPGRATGFLVTLFMLLGVLPYLSLQIRAVTDSLEVLTRHSAPSASPLLAALFCVIAILFAVLFGARHAQPHEKHEGLVTAIAFESLVKLFALLAVGGFALYGVFGGPAQLQDWLNAHPQTLQKMYRPVGNSAWTTLLLLTFSAAFLLPRQFHMLFTENQSRHGLRTASWLFSLFLLLLNLPIPIILWAVQSRHLGGPPDYYLLALAQQHGIWLTLFAFVGGVSAASAMLIVESLALAGMCLNHIVLPLWLRAGNTPSGDLYLKLRRWRRLLLLVIIATGYGAYLAMRESQGLAQLGLISFVAVTQFLPGIVAMLLWPGATRVGFIAGICGGMAVWFVMLILPLLNLPHLIPGLNVPLDGTESHWPFVTFWSLTVNSTLLALGSLLSRPQPREIAADQAVRLNAMLLRERVRTPGPAELQQQLAPALGTDNARRELQRALQECGLADDEWRPHPLLRLEACLERNLSGLLGPHLARQLLGRDAQTSPSGSLVEEQLEESGEQFTGLAAELDHLRRLHRQVLQDLPVGACSIDNRGIVRLWNQRLSTLSTLDENSLLGLTLTQLPAPWAGLLSGFLSLADAHLYKIELKLDSGVCWLNLHKETVGRTSDGGVVVLLEDLTEQRLLEAELAHTERLASIGTFAAGVAHEIGNPLTGITSLAQNLRLDSDAPAVHAGIDEILQQSRRIQNIVRSLLSFSHAGAVEPQPATHFALAECVDEALRLARLTGGRALRFKLKIPAGLLIWAEYSRLLQVLVNLLVNAVDASPPGSLVQVCARVEDNAVMLWVEDQGCGIAEDLHERVFEPFFTTKAPGRGTGLGLPLVYGIVRDHGGEVRLDSTPGTGTRVTLRLPQPQPTTA